MLNIYTMVEDDKREKYDTSFLNEEVAREVHDYHMSFPMYEETPFVDLKILQKRLE